MKILQFNVCLIEIGVLSENSKGWRKELNKISWNGAAPKYDIRDWALEHEKMARALLLDMSEISNRVTIEFFGKETRFRLALSGILLRKKCCEVMPK